MKIRTNITILINEYLLRNITRYEQYYNLSLVSNKFLIINLSLTITFNKLGTFFASKSQGGECPPAPPCIRPCRRLLRPSESNTALYRGIHYNIVLEMGLQWTTKGSSIRRLLRTSESNTYTDRYIIICSP